MVFLILGSEDTFNVVDLRFLISFGLVVGVVVEELSILLNPNSNNFSFLVGGGDGGGGTLLVEVDSVF